MAGEDANVELERAELEGGVGVGAGGSGLETNKRCDTVHCSVEGTQSGGCAFRNR